MKKRRIDPFFEIFEQMRREMEELIKGTFMEEDLFEKAFRDMSKKGKSKVYGIHITVGPDGKPIVKEFGNVKPKTEVIGSEEEASAETPKGLEEAREPLVETHVEKDTVSIVAEVPGVQKEDIDLELVEDDVLVIKVDTAERKYYKKIKLPAHVDEKSIKATYKNGILEVKLKIKKAKKKSKKKSVKVE